MGQSNSTFSGLPEKKFDPHYFYTLGLFIETAQLKALECNGSGAEEKKKYKSFLEDLQTKCCVKL